MFSQSTFDLLLGNKDHGKIGTCLGEKMANNCCIYNKLQPGPFYRNKVFFCQKKIYSVHRVFVNLSDSAQFRTLCHLQLCFLQRTNHLKPCVYNGCLYLKIDFGIPPIISFLLLLDAQNAQIIDI